MYNLQITLTGYQIKLMQLTSFKNFIYYVKNFYKQLKNAELLTLIYAQYIVILLTASPAIAHFIIPDKNHHTLVTDALSSYNEGDLAQAIKIAKSLPDKTHRTALTWLVLMEVEDEQALEELIGFYRSQNDWPFLTVTRKKIEQSFNDKSRPKMVLDWFKEHPPLTTKGQKTYLKFLIHGQVDQKTIAELVKDIWLDGNFSDTEERYFEQKYGQYLSEEDYYRRIDNLIWQKQYAEARKLTRHLGSDRAHLVNARLAYLEDKTGKELLLKLVPRKYLDNEGLLYSILMRSSEDDDHELFNKYFSKIKSLQDLSHTERWCCLVNMEVRNLLENGFYDEAYHLSLRACDFSKSKAADSYWLSGWIALRSLEDPQLAIEHFSKQLELVKMPISKSRAAYWLGRSYAELDNSGEAQKYYKMAAQYPFTFYGLLAQEELGNKYLKGVLNHNLPDFSEAELSQLSGSRNMNIAYIVSQSRWYDLAHHLISEELEKTDSHYHKHLIVIAGKKFGRPDLGLVAAKKAMYHNIVDYEAAYPYIKESFMNKPILVNALTRQESLFNKNAVSSAGAMGLMQLMPQTAKISAKQLGLSYDEKKLTRDGKYNLKLGSNHIDQLHGDLNSNILAIASYNAGDTPIKKWVVRFGDPRKMKNTYDIIDWVEKIPYGETRNYVHRVVENMQIYRSLIDGKTDLAVRISDDLKS